MGIYSDGNVYGISFIINEIAVFEKKYEDKMVYIQIQEAKEFYNALSIEEKELLIVRFYTSCSTTYNSDKSDSSMMWFPGSKDLLENLFNLSL